MPLRITSPFPNSSMPKGSGVMDCTGFRTKYIASQLPAVSPALATKRGIVADLGSGASMCALSNGRSIESTMRFIALDSLPMGTRPEQVDRESCCTSLRERTPTTS